MRSALYRGSLEHRRHQPRRHAFRYGLFLAYLDLAELDSVFRGRWFWSTSRFALARFDRRDHFGDPALPLDESVRRLVAERTGTRPDGPVRLLTHLRYFGHVFNPVCFYYCFDAADRAVETIVAEVNNTPWGERHCYVLRNGEGEATAREVGAVRATSRKAMHVSPFHPMELDYRWCFTAPGERLGVRMTLHSADDGRAMQTPAGGDSGGATDAAAAGAPQATLFDAALSLRRIPIGAASLAGVLLRYPLMTLQVVAAIHWQAFRLWLKRVPVHDHPSRRASTAARSDSSATTPELTR